MAAVPARLPCGWCEEPNRWPDCCGPPDPVCVDEIEWHHREGDHRRCSPSCDGFALLVRVAEEAQAACRKDGKPFAVVSTYDDPWVVRTFDRLQQAKPFRSRVGKAHGAKLSIEFKAVVFVVRADGVIL